MSVGATETSHYDAIVIGGGSLSEWLQQATLAIRARVPLSVLLDTIQPFPTFSEIYLEALKALHAEVAAEESLSGARSR